jgi:hypothetical protein
MKRPVLLQFQQKQNFCIKQIFTTLKNDKNVLTYLTRLSFTYQICTLTNKTIHFCLTLDETNTDRHYLISSVVSINLRNYGV